MHPDSYFKDSDLDDFVSVENNNYVTLRDWQRRAIKYFEDNDYHALFEVTTGCITGDTLIELPRDLTKYPKGIKIKDLVDKKDFYVYSFNLTKSELELKKCTSVWKVGKKIVYEILFESGRKIQATENHKFLVDEIGEQMIKSRSGNFFKRPWRHLVNSRKYVQLKDLKEGEYITSWNRRKDQNLIRVNYNSKSNELEHRFIMSQIKGEQKMPVHHIDGNHDNNEINNLEYIFDSEHSRIHSTERGLFGKQIWKGGKHPRGMLGKHHKDKGKFVKGIVKQYNKEYTRTDDFRNKVSINSSKGYFKLKQDKVRWAKHLENISKNVKVNYNDKMISITKIGLKDVYDMEVEDNHNFIANGLIIHNSGKTYFAIETLKRMMIKFPKMKTLIVVPKNVILETGWYKELVEAGLPIQDIGVYYGQIKEYAKITITNLQSLKRIPLEIFDFLIIDEAHNFGTNKLLAKIRHPFKFKMGLSATIQRQDNKHFELMEVFHYNVFKYDPTEALADGVLNPFNFVNIGVLLDEEARDGYELISTQYTNILFAGGGYHKIMNSTSPLKNKMLALLTERKQLVNNFKTKFEIVRKILEHHKTDKVIIFNQFIDQTNKMYWYLLDSGVQAKLIHSGVSNEDRDKVLMDFKLNKFNVLITTKVLDEGYNLPKLDVAIITASDSADKQTIQRMGRVLRKKDKDSVIYQTYCVDTIEEENAIKRSVMLKGLATKYKEFIYDEDEFNIEV